MASQAYDMAGKSSPGSSNMIQNANIQCYNNFVQSTAVHNDTLPVGSLHVLITHIHGFIFPSFVFDQSVNP
jgi:hypothetical protein